MSRIACLASLLMVVAASYYSISSTRPPNAVAATAPAGNFSADRAAIHLQQICQQPHSIGTEYHDRVRDYLLNACRQLGLSPVIQETTALSTRWGGLDVARVQNIIATIKGTATTKAVMLMAHYDSQPNTFGAGDDGAGCAGILETIRALKAGAALKNDLHIVFTDGEEIGMLGAEGLLQDSASLLKNVGVIINFEGRGNEGMSNMFEVNADNGWVMREFEKAAPHPFANSLGYEVYKKLPNYTDYTVFKEANITGLNNAHIQGFVNYHSMTDRFENMDLNTLQHHGANMLALARHFGNLNIIDTKAPDVTYFNALPKLFLLYPASWNFYFLVLTDLLFLFWVIVTIRKGVTRFGQLMAGTGLFALTLILVLLAGILFRKAILYFYPLYNHFYEGNGYNSSSYFMAMTGLGIALFTFLYHRYSRKWTRASLTAGALVVITIFTNLMQWAVPSAGYLLIFPLAIIITTLLASSGKRAVNAPSPGTISWIPAIGAVLVAFLLCPAIYFMFIAFGLGTIVPAVLAILVILLGLLLPVILPSLLLYKKLLPFGGLLLMLLFLVAGHLKSGYSMSKPVQTDLRYVLDADSMKANWVSDFETPDKWTKRFFKSARYDEGPGKGHRKMYGDAPLLNLAPVKVDVIHDTTIQQQRQLSLQLTPGRDKVCSIRIWLDNNIDIDEIAINGKHIGGKNEPGSGLWKNHLYYAGMTPSGIKLTMAITNNKPVRMVVDDRSMGLPQLPEPDTSFPPDVIPGPGSNSNTVQVRKSYTF